jgi:hypothetical protein
MLALWIPLIEVTRYRLFIFFNRSYRKTPKITLAVSYIPQVVEKAVFLRLFKALLICMWRPGRGLL